MNILQIDNEQILKYPLPGINDTNQIDLDKFNVHDKSMDKNGMSERIIKTDGFLTAEQKVKIEEKTIKERENELSKEYKYKDRFEKKDVGNVLVAFLNRTRFNYQIREIIVYITKCMCLRSLHKRRN